MAATTGINSVEDGTNEPTSRAESGPPFATMMVICGVWAWDNNGNCGAKQKSATKTIHTSLTSTTAATKDRLKLIIVFEYWFDFPLYGFKNLEQSQRL